MNPTGQEQVRSKSSNLIYGLHDHPALRESIFVALQHLLAIFVAIITPPLIILNALNFDLETMGFLVSMSLSVSGVATFIQCHHIGPTGTELLYIQGTSFPFIGPIVGAGMLGMVGDKLNTEMALSYIFTACVSASAVEMLVSRLLKYTRRTITPLVSGIVVMLIGMSLVKAGINSCGGGAAAEADGLFGSLVNLGLAVLVLFSITIFNRSSNRFPWMSSIVLGLLIGYIAAYLTGMTHLDSTQNYGGFITPVPFKYRFRFDISALTSLGLVYLITAIEAYGDITASSLISGESIEGEVFKRRASGGTLADGFSSILAVVFNSFPNSIFTQNNGMIQLTGIASHYIGYYIVGALAILGLFPVIGLVFSLIPAPVLDGATLLMFGIVAAAGIKIIASTQINREAVLVMAISFALGLSVEMVPGILDHIPGTIRNIFSLGITTGGLTAILTNAFIKIKG